MYNKIFGIGLPKTGTSSLATYMTARGVNTLHFGSNDANEIRNKIYQGIYKFDVMDRYDGLTNCGENYFEQFDREYPGSKFILTTRDKEEWLDSIERHWSRWVAKVGVRRVMTVNHHLITFGTYLFNKDRFSYVYDYTHEMIWSYFRDRRDDLFVLKLNNLKNEEIEKLCEFIEVPYDGKPYKQMNRS